MKDRRQRAILTLVATRPIHSQDELVALLEKQGYEVTQATVSRDIKELGLIKVPIKTESDDDALFKYVVPSATVNYVSRLHRVVSELVLGAEGSVNLIVLRTPPGSAMMVASAIDEAAWPEIIGTVGGDDTILVIVRSAEEMPVIKQRFLDLKGTNAA
ncbi:MAG TPA: arginine repressor [Candidatus Dormibacteraeota bacterium]|nr:arginine repressor [Candidatus Dormibacteraeota bacterium]